MVPKTSKKEEAKSLTLDAWDIQGKKTGKLELNPQVFDGKVNLALIHQAVVAYLANQRKGLASAKTRGMVSGGGVKPWRQKGTGRARVGSIRSPLWKGGGVIFGPKPHSYYKKLSKKMRRLALKSALNAKFKDQQILILDDLVVNSPKTKSFFTVLKNLKLTSGKVRFVVDNLENNLKLASRNIQNIFLTRAEDLCAFEVVDCKKLVLTKEALRILEERLKSH